MSTPAGLDPLHLVLGDDEFLIERAVSTLIKAVRGDRGQGISDLPITRMRAGDANAPELAELLSPSLFAEDRVIVLEAAAEAGKDAVALVLDAAREPSEGVVLIVLHSGGGRAKALAPALEKLGAVVHQCAKLNKSQLTDFVRAEFSSAQVKVSPAVIGAMIESVGSNLRELASACSQLAADTGGKIDVDAVHQYYSGRAEVSGFDVADKVIVGDTRGALEALRWADQIGTPHVLLADALADAVHTVAKVGPYARGGDPFRLASELGMPPWKVKKAIKEVKGWDPASIGAAMQIVAALNADVKGAAVDSSYALESAVRKVCALRK
ncbi:DNA polymerase III subunit delta [Rhodococcus sp. ACPA4]|uniref:DNA polymerase III subunit delta n=1 Tax=unclassified Rhodococcus (in: high G+C Gram-positive bacteria) TaxID=192944 RepID=UPI000BB11FAB|nr:MULTISPECIES: DNA polymerase III subunit delta [unclassified Rhodococcus (in: high G+C Gram-positive bacteria)]PBC40325.1 DNA polymerase III subunit delta [Rhodococcus sp. ACPA4]ROZ46554.1 DNA polymerase III subunit delta [Rhodococcus sp. WS3]